MEELEKIIDEYPICVPVSVVAAYLKMSPQCLRASMDQNRCPFGFGWKLGDRNGYKIPTVSLVSWLTKGTFNPNLGSPV